MDIGLHTLPARLVPEQLLARIFGVKGSLTALAGAAGAFVTPFAIDLLGMQGAMFALGLIAPALTALAWQRLRKIDAMIEQRDAEIAVLNHVPMFRPLPIPAIDGLALHVEEVQFEAGQVICRQGDDADRFYLIEDGAAEVIGDDRLIRTLDPGDSFGEIALLGDTGVRPPSARGRHSGCTPSTGTRSAPRSAPIRRASARRTPSCSTGSCPPEGPGPGATAATPGLGRLGGAEANQSQGGHRMKPTVMPAPVRRAELLVERSRQSWSLRGGGRAPA